MNVAEPKLVLIAHVEVHSPGAVKLILPVALNICHEADRNIHPADRGEASRSLRHVRPKSVAQNTKIGSGNTPERRQSVQTGRCGSGDEAAHGALKAQRYVFEITKKENFTRYKRHAE